MEKNKIKKALKDINFWIIEGFFIAIIFGVPFVQDSKDFIIDLSSLSLSQASIQLFLVFLGGYLVYWFATSLAPKRRR